MSINLTKFSTNVIFFSEKMAEAITEVKEEEVKELLKEGSDIDEVDYKAVQGDSVSFQLTRTEMLDAPVKEKSLATMESPKSLTDLPPEIVLKIMECLDVRSALKLWQTCKLMHSLSHDNQLWNTFWERDTRDDVDENGYVVDFLVSVWADASWFSVSFGYPIAMMRYKERVKRSSLKRLL